MPDYEFTDPKTGRTLTVTGPTPPSESMLRALFADADKKAPPPASTETAPGGPSVGPDTGALLQSDPEAVTLGDLIRDPKAAFSKMFAITKKGLSDPRNTIPAAIGLAAGAAGILPPSFASTRGGWAPVSGPMNGPAQMVASPAATSAAPARPSVVQGLRTNVKLDDLVGMIPGAENAKATYRVARGVQRALGGESAPPAEAAPTPAPTPDVPVTPTPTPLPVTPKPTKTAPSPKPKAAPKASSAPAAESLPSLDELSLTPAEIQQGVKWHEQGVSPETIIHRILQSRQLTQRLHTETPDQAAEAVRQRNETGRWKD